MWCMVFCNVCFPATLTTISLIPCAGACSIAQQLQHSHQASYTYAVMKICTYLKTYLLVVGTETIVVRQLDSELQPTIETFSLRTVAGEKQKLSREITRYYL